MSNIIPPLLSSSPPPMIEAAEDEDDEFGDFTFATDAPYDCDDASVPQKSTTTDNQSIPNHNCDLSNQITDINLDFQNSKKDFQDRRKTEQTTSDSKSNSDQEPNSNTDGLVYNITKININVESKYNSFQYFPDVPPDILPDHNEDERAEAENRFIDELQDLQGLEHSESISNINNETNVESYTDDVISNNSKELKDLEPEEEIPNKILNASNSHIYTVDEQPIEISQVETNDIKNDGQISSLPGQNPKQGVLHYENFNSLVTGQAEECANLQLSDKTSNTIDVLTSEHLENDELPLPYTTETNPIHEGDASSTDDFGNFENHFVNSEVSVGELTQFSNISQITHSKNSTRPELPSDLDLNSEQREKKFISQVELTEDTDTNEDFGDFENQVFEELHLASSTINYDTSLIVSSVCGKSEVQVFDDNADDDFGDFNDYSQTSQPQEVAEHTKSLNIDANAVPEKAKTIISLMFPPCDQPVKDYNIEDFISNDCMFDNLKDVTDTNALLYQWNKSRSQSCLLHALNIDTRNILYGPRWNESMPRYAATLGFAPLEPVKSEILNPMMELPATSSSQASSTESIQQTDIPSAQFDWIGSGLTNPLENSPGNTMLLDLEQLVASLDIHFSSTLPFNSSNSPSPVDDLDDWEFWLRLTPNEAQIVKQSDPCSETKKDIFNGISIETELKPAKLDLPSALDSEAGSVISSSTNVITQSQDDNESVKSLQLHVKRTEASICTDEMSNNDFNDFTSFQSSYKPEESSSFVNWSSVNTVPLRETHISNVNIQNKNVLSLKSDKSCSTLEEPGWLKPTILTPDLPRKESAHIPEAMTDEGTEDEEFSDFQMVQTINNQNLPKNSINRTKPNCVLSGDDDEFTDFQSTLPSPTVISFSAPEPLQPNPTITEPLQPSIIQPTVTSANATTVINWPDPGISDDDLKRIELFYKPNAEVSNSTVSMKDNLIVSSLTCSEQTSKAIPTDEDDWSDFVSNKEPQLSVNHVVTSLSKTAQMKQPSRTSTPELQLSVPQLNQIQPPKKPVPVITQQGLQQTRTFSTLPIPTLVQPPIQQSKQYFNKSQQNDVQPSLISNQFAAQFGQGLLNHSNHLNKPIPKINEPKQMASNMPQDNITKIQHQPLESLVSSNKMEDIDDEWSDFVCSEPISPTTVPNGLSPNLPKPPKLNLDWNRPPQFTSWSTNVTPNIITNPVSFDTFQSYSVPVQTDLLKNKTGNKRSSNATMQPKKSTTPSISMVPDMEFIAPKNRAWKK